jgi:hypothetical protein
MGEEKWTRRKPGRASGTVVPPPVGDDPAPLPESRRPGRIRHRPDGLPDARTQPSVPPEPPVPEMPDNVRLLFRPVLSSSEDHPAKDRRREPNFRPARSPDGNEVLDLPSRPVHGPAIRALNARRHEGAAPSGSTVTTPRPRSARWHAAPVAGPGLDTAGSGTAGGQAGGGGPQTYVLDPRPMQPRASRGILRRRREAGLSTPPGAGYRRHLAWMTAVTLLLLLTAVGTTVALLRQHGSGKPAAGGAPGGGGGTGPGSVTGPGSGTVLAGAAASRAAAARWVSREITRSAIIGCDKVMCGALANVGVPSADLLPMTPSSQDPLGADVLVATPALQSQFGSRLSTQYAPAVLASFGRGDTRVQVRVIASYGASAYQLALNRDLAARELLGTQLVGNSQIALPVSARTELAAGQVDPRLLITLPALAHKHPIRIMAFYDRAPGASSGVPLSGVRLAGWDPKARLSAHAYTRWLVSFLRGQRSVWRAAHVAVSRRNGRAIVSVRFARPNPIGLLH